MPSEKVALDACVLFPFSVRDVLLRAADAIDIYELCLTEEILEETRRNLVSSGYVTEEQGQRLVRQLQSYFRDAFEMNYEHLIPKMPINEKDRHVLAAAVAGKAQIIVTENLKDFPPELLQPLGIEAMSADTFLVHLFMESEAKKAALLTVMREHISGLKKPPLTAEEALSRLEKLVPHFTQLVRNEL